MKFDLGDFWQTAKIILRKSKFTTPSLFNTPKARLCSSNEANLCDEDFSNNFNLDDSDVYLHVFPCGNNQKRIILIISKLVNS